MKYQEKINSFIKSTYEPIEVKPGKCRYNFRCHQNSVHDAINKKDKKIAMVMCISKDESYCFIHFVNKRKGKYIDNTLGVWAVEYDFYLVRHIKKDDFFNVITIFQDYRKYLKGLVPWWVKLYKNVEF